MTEKNHMSDAAQAEQVRAKTIAECASHLEQKADLLTNSLHCGDNSATIAAAHKKSRQLYEAAAIINELAFASQPSPAATVETGPVTVNEFEDVTAGMNARQAAINESMARPNSSAGSEVEEDDPDVLIAAHAIAVNGFGRPWDDFHVTNAFDTDQGDLLQYAQAAVSALRSRVLPQGVPVPSAGNESSAPEGQLAGRDCPGVLESDPALFDILNNALGTMHYHRLMSAMNWNGYVITREPQAVPETAVERFQKRVVKMIGEGFRGFHFTAGDTWDSLTTEQKCAYILEMWDAPKVGDGLPVSTRRAPTDIRKLVDDLSSPVSRPLLCAHGVKIGNTCVGCMGAATLASQQGNCK